MESRIYTNVKKKIEQRGKTIRQFEMENLMANGTIGKWKTEGNPRISTLEKVAAALDVDIRDLLE